MGVDLDTVGTSGAETIVTWEADDAILYALGVGAGRDPLRELEYTTENSRGVQLRALPTLAVVLGQRAARPRYGDIDLKSIVHGGQELRWFGELPAAGSARVATCVSAIEDKGSGALISLETTARDTETSEDLFISTSRIFARGYGGFGRSCERTEESPAPTGKPDAEYTFETRQDQALLYRLTGDRNPLHADPAFAQRAGFSQPILHGLCTYGFSARVLLHEVVGSDPARMRCFSARFAKPVLPGDALTVQVWRQSDGVALFRTVRDDVTVIDQGRLEYDE